MVHEVERFAVSEGGDGVGQFGVWASEWLGEDVDGAWNQLQGRVTKRSTILNKCLFKLKNKLPVSYVFFKYYIHQNINLSKINSS